MVGVHTLTAPFGGFLVIWAGHALTRAAWRAGLAGAGTEVGLGRSALDGGPHLGRP